MGPVLFLYLLAYPVAVPADYETGRAALESLVSWASQHDWNRKRNEAQTRKDLIDRLFFDCLGWRHEDCHVEVMHDGAFSDYQFRAEAASLLVEAKKEGIYFDLPAGLEKRSLRLDLLCAQEPDVDKAVDQALGYCHSRGMPLGCVANGNQLVAFIASRQDNTPPKEGRALVFRSLEDMLEGFKDLWDALSRPGVLEARAIRLLTGGQTLLPPDKLSSRIQNYKSLQVRNLFQLDFNLLGTLFLQDLPESPEKAEEFLRRCYYPSGALAQNAWIGKEILKTRYARLLNEKGVAGTQPVATKGGIVPELVDDIAAASISRKPLILLGDVGAGKTTFIQHFVHLDAQDILEDSLVFVLDCGEHDGSESTLKRFVTDQYVSQLKSNYGISMTESAFVREVYADGIEDFGRSVMGELRELDEKAYLLKELEFLEQEVRDDDQHLKKVFEHFSATKPIVVFLDNVDQRSFHYQDEAFMLAISLAATWPGTIFISLRPDTFYRSQSEGSLSAYQPRVFTVSPPRTDRVIEKRIGYARSLIKNHEVQAEKVSPETLDSYLEVIEKSLSANSDLADVLENLSGGNLRRALGFLIDFVGSPHVNTLKILTIVKETGRYVIPTHEFIRAIMFGDRHYYDPASSPIANVFDVSAPDSREHFLLPIILDFSRRMAERRGAAGTVSAEEIYALSSKLGFSPAQVSFALDRAIKKDLLDLYDPGSGGLSTTYRITAVGAYTVSFLMSHFTYLDAMIIDTPIMDLETRKKLVDAKSIADRLSRVECFRQYLDRAWQRLPSKDVPFDWPSVSEALASETSRIGRRLSGRTKPKRPSTR